MYQILSITIPCLLLVFRKNTVNSQQVYHLIYYEHIDCHLIHILNNTIFHSLVQNQLSSQRIQFLTIAVWFTSILQRSIQQRVHSKSLHQKTCPLQTQKWLWQPVSTRTEGVIVGRPFQLLTIQCGNLSVLRARVTI